MSLPLYLTYLGVTIVFCATPGPSVLLVVSQAISGGFGAGARAALGVQLGASLFWLVSALGLTALLVTSAEAFTVVKFAGAAYLVCLGAYTIWNARRAARAIAAERPVSVWRSPFVQGLVGHLANPKAVLFYIALLPQFIAPGHAPLAAFAPLWATGIGVDLSIMLIYSAIAARGGVLFRDAAHVVWRERISGAAQIAVGGLLAGVRRAT